MNGGMAALERRDAAMDIFMALVMWLSANLQWVAQTLRYVTVALSVFVTRNRRK